MKFKMTPTKVCAAMILVVVAFGFTLSSLNNALTRYEKRNNSSSGFTLENRSPGARLFSEISQPIAKEPLARLFQVLFILFFISPPLIVVLLFLIWKELKARNKLK